MKFLSWPDLAVGAEAAQGVGIRKRGGGCEAVALLPLKRARAERRVFFNGSIKDYITGGMHSKVYPPSPDT